MQSKELEVVQGISVTERTKLRIYALSLESFQFFVFTIIIHWRINLCFVGLSSRPRKRLQFLFYFAHFCALEHVGSLIVLPIAMVHED